MKKIILSASKGIYIWLVRKASHRKLLLKNKLVLVISFPETSSIFIEKIYENMGNNFVICYTEKTKALAKQFKNKGCEIYNIDSFFTLLVKIVPVINNASLVICDNYFPFLAGISLNKKRKIIQIWHANGAIKTFGLEAEYAKKESIQDKRRYKEVYKRFTHVMVSSLKMAKIFEKNYKNKYEILPFAYPLTDLYFDNDWLNKSKKKFEMNFFSNKKILLYVPTYRENNNKNPINFSRLSNELGEGWRILAKAHPHDYLLQDKLKKEESIISDFKGMSLNELYPFVDCLVTDYSSTIFEYSLANPSGKIVFFCYDIEEYRQSVGIEPDFEEWAPGNIVTTENELINAIKEPQPKNFDTFNKLWNEYVQGNSIKQLMEWIDKNEKQ